MKIEKYRDQVTDYLQAQLIGPSMGSDELIEGKPFWRYFGGILFPAGIDIRSLGESDEPDTAATSSDVAFADPSLGMAYATTPSSMGISFYFSGSKTISITVLGARYQNVGEKASDAWQRIPLSDIGDPEIVTIGVPERDIRQIVKSDVFEGRAMISALFRPKGEGFLVTITLVNTQIAEGSNYDVNQVQKMLFQCGFEVSLESGEIGTYPTVARKSKHPEDEELALIYRKRATKGIGHGCAASWPDYLANEPLRVIKANPLPMQEVKGLTNDVDVPPEAESVLSIQWLANPENSKDELAEGLNSFLDAYENWMKDQQNSLSSLEDSDKEAANRITNRQTIALSRMREGAKILLCEPEALRAFKIAQQAMLLQFLWVQRKGKSPFEVGAGLTEKINLWEPTYANSPRWRPFQLGFQLLVIASLIDGDHDDRDTLDLLWFPTGGGKTEAYLALAAFEMIMRRHRYSDAGAGTSVIMRYTLRLLTAQQFERCASLISALEVMRKSDETLGLTSRPFRLGLWVGGDTSPNRLHNPVDGNPGAVQLFQSILKSKSPENPFHLNACPACGTRIIPKNHSTEEHYGIDVSSERFRMFCPDKSCDLHEEIPVSVVDEDLFREPPTFLIGTIDKFARMTWDPRSRVFFGLSNTSSGDRTPPSLIIQDELHLITGPLGTIAGTYEAAIDTLIKDQGITPKYLAATATIQRASEQVRSLYARDAFVFPPSGIECDDSFFTREDKNTPGRSYVGAMGHGLYSALTSLVQVSAAAAACSMQVSEKETIESRGVLARDGYWTQVIYHNSRQELGKTTTMLRDDVATRLELLQPNAGARREFNRIQELSANLKGSEITETLEQLQVSIPNEAAIDALACTNMISVGVDIGRLGLMIIKSQPKSTAEYIQASSRVGRDANLPPGIVIALYAANRPRDRSHYEDFQSYHTSLYRAVEPATVTPFSPQALERTLHASLIIPIRMSLGWEDASSASHFDPLDPDITRLIEGLKKRIQAAARDEDEKQFVFDRLNDLVSEWQRIVAQDPNIIFNSGNVAHHKLLCDFPSDDPKNVNAHWPTLSSMRHVDGEAELGLEIGGG